MVSLQKEMNEMADKKTYQNKEVTRERLNNCIRELTGCGMRDLPSERDLCTITGGSRKIIRELLLELEANGSLIRRNQKREIAEFETKSKEIPLLFSSIGHNMVENRSWAKLWFTLSRLAPDYGIKPELVLVGWPWKKAVPALRYIQSSPAKYLIVTNSYEGFQKNHFDFDSKLSICTDEHCSTICRNVVSLDNREAGRIAARELYNAGYRAPALFAEIHTPSYLPFEYRVAGFREECETLGIPLSDSDIYTMHYHGRSNKANLLDTTAQAERIAKAGKYDSLFSIVDERVPLICDTLLEHRIHYGDIGIISLNGSNISMNYHFPFTVVSSATKGIAMQIIRSVLDVESGRKTSVGQIRIKPDVLNRESLYNK